MHPILSQKKRLAAYLAAWIAPAAMLIYLLATSGELSWLEAVALGTLLADIYAFVCLSAWYLCRAVPGHSYGLPRLWVTSLAAAIAASAIWTVLAKGIAQAAERLGFFDRLSERLDRHVPMLFGVGVLFYLLAVAFQYSLIVVDASRQTQLLARDSELKALKAQVNPHFLFNSLHSISALTSIDPARAREMALRLSDFLRSSLGLGEKESIPLAEELALVKSYLEVEQVRFGPRLRFLERIEEPCLRCLVPPLLLQPLVENAVRHGIANLVEGGGISIDARLLSVTLSLAIENDVDPEAPAPRTTGRGLANVRARLQLRYGSAARFDAGLRGGRFRVELALPAETEENR